MQLLGPAYMDYALNGRDGGPKGNEHPLAGAAPHGVFPCAGDDRWISIAVMNDEEWRGLVAAMGQPAWTEAYAALQQRLDDIDVLHARVAQWSTGFEDIALAETLQSHGVAAAPVYNVADLLQCPHYRARGTFIEVQHPLGFTETIYGPYVKTSATKISLGPGPVMGCDNERVFKGILGLAEERFRQLVAQQVIY